jgi:hypothetical protein
MEYDDKTMALAKFLEVDPALIENDYGDYYTVNARQVKRGKTPEQYKKVAEDFRFLLNEEMQELITDAIVNPHPPEKLDEVYSTVSKYLEPIGERAVKRAEQMARLSYKPAKETVEDVYNRLKQDNLYVVNVLYYLVKADKSDYNTDHMVSLRRAWLGQPVSDTRKDEIAMDGEYRVLTDDEADDAEREYLDDLFDQIVEVPSHLQNYVDKDKWIDDNSGNRGENLNGYDGNEEEVEFEGTTYYIYRNN